jgi:tRNA-splicing ligase RtcB (3'-phosphate/5'-hydroxy nucleic acid ligase)
VEIIAESPYRFVIPRHGRMRVPGVVFATRALIPDPAADHALEQVVNVAELPGIVARRRLSGWPRARSAS